VTENQPARQPAAARSDWQDIYLRDQDGGTDVMFDGGVTGWPIHGDGGFTRAAGPDGEPLTAQAAAGYARSLNAAGGGASAPVRGGTGLEAERSLALSRGSAAANSADLPGMLPHPAHDGRVNPTTGESPPLDAGRP